MHTINKQILKIIRELLEYTPQSTGTNISEAMRGFTNSLKKRCIGFLISDFLDTDNQLNLKFEDALRLASRKHDLVALRVVDKLEMELQDAITNASMTTISAPNDSIVTASITNRHVLLHAFKMYHYQTHVL